jgi:hypothetical protein
MILENYCLVELTEMKNEKKKKTKQKNKQKRVVEQTFGWENWHGYWSIVVFDSFVK